MTRARFVPGFRRRHGAGEHGFTLVELMIAVALLGIGTTFMTTLFIKSYQNWKWSFDSMILQRNVRLTMARVTKVLREAKPGSIAISTPAGAPKWSMISFTDARGQGWIIRQDGRRIQMVMPIASGGSATSYVATDIDALSFLFPSFQDTSLIDVGIVGRKVSYARAPNPVLVQLVERVLLRNP